MVEAEELWSHGNHEWLYVPCKHNSALGIGVNCLEDRPHHRLRNTALCTIASNFGATAVRLQQDGQEITRSQDNITVRRGELAYSHDFHDTRDLEAGNKASFSRPFPTGQDGVPVQWQAPSPPHSSLATSSIPLACSLLLNPFGLVGVSCLVIHKSGTQM